MRVVLTVSAILLAGPVALAAQQVEDVSRDSLRQQIMDRFSARVEEELALTDGQAAKLTGTVRTYFAKRRALEAEERGLRTALAGQLRPGVAADQDSVSKLMNSITDVRQRYIDTFEEENKAMSAYLTPVQRAQYFVLRERLLERIKRVREGRNGKTKWPRQ